MGYQELRCFAEIVDDREPRTQKHRFIQTVGDHLRGRLGLPFSYFYNIALESGNPISEQWARRVVGEHMNCARLDEHGTVFNYGIPKTDTVMDRYFNYGGEFPEICRSCSTFAQSNREVCPILAGNNLEMISLEGGGRFINGVPYERIICDLGGGSVMEAMQLATDESTAVVVIDPIAAFWVKVFNSKDPDSAFNLVNDLIGEDEVNFLELEVMFALKRQKKYRGGIYPVNGHFENQTGIPQGFFDNVIVSYPFPTTSDEEQDEIREFAARVLHPLGSFRLRTGQDHIFKRMLDGFNNDPRFSNCLIMNDKAQSRVRYPITMYSLRMAGINEMSELAFVTVRKDDII